MVDSTTHASQQTVTATTNPQVDIEELRRVCQSVEESRREARAQIYKIRRDFYTGLQEKEQLIKSAKVQLEENGELEEEGCIFCSWANAESEEELPKYVQDKVIADYYDVRKHSFHCDQEDHVKAFHKIVGPVSQWSCCRSQA